MKFFKLVTAVSLLVLTACASWSGLSDKQRIALYQEHAGEPIDSFHYFGSLNSWMPLGDEALVVWTRPSQAYLLELFGPCPGLEYTPAISVTGQFGMVSAGFDEVIVLNDPGVNLPCRIEAIRPIDVDALDAAKEDLREQVEMVERDRPPEESATDTSGY